MVLLLPGHDSRIPMQYQKWRIFVFQKMVLKLPIEILIIKNHSFFSCFDFSAYLPFLFIVFMSYHIAMQRESRAFIGMATIFSKFITCCFTIFIKSCQCLDLFKTIFSICDFLLLYIIKIILYYTVLYFEIYRSIYRKKHLIMLVLCL